MGPGLVPLVRFAAERRPDDAEGERYAFANALAVPWRYSAHINRKRPDAPFPYHSPLRRPPSRLSETPVM
jgi:hypothetical protein